ncbi:uncharacterized protein DEA37_0006685 [Paragonimus westermani]|uniref:Uncharacterized protein n=1 Tax=Paragonimus westermani TaxID=34504 RepID=A0A5J4NRH4_9TREM|nr:uncharacterized protein DEA37_0006685 [Paragonimus westermani]
MLDNPCGLRPPLNPDIPVGFPSVRIGDPPVPTPDAHAEWTSFGPSFSSTEYTSDLSFHTYFYQPSFWFNLQLPFECGIYFIQHLLLLLVPVILVDQTTVYTVEPFDDLSWVVLSLSLQVLYHFLILQPIALITGINLNNILCPAISDPFKGPHYRLVAMVHQPFLILILGKSITYFGLTWNAQLWWWQNTFLVNQSQPSQKSSVSTGGDLLDTWLKPEPEAKEISLNATPWCWTDLFRYQTYMVSAQTDPVYPLHKSSPVDKPTTVVD